MSTTRQHMDAWRDHRNSCIYCVDFDDMSNAPLRCNYGGEQILARVKGLPEPPLRQPVPAHRPISNLAMAAAAILTGVAVGCLLFAW